MLLGKQEGAQQAAQREAEVKPAGQPADFRSVASVIALRTNQPDGFKNLSALWVTNFLCEGHVFVHRLSGKYYISLGVVFQAAWLWEIQEVSHGLFRLVEPGLEDYRKSIQYASISTLGSKGQEDERERFAGVPVRLSLGLSVLCPTCCDRFLLFRTHFESPLWPRSPI